jgi:hypothetical protein
MTARLSLAAMVVALVIIGQARGDVPSGWFAAGSDPTSYEFTIDTKEKKGGKASGSYEAKDPKADNFGTAMQQFAADDFKGKRVRMSAWVKAKDVDEWAGLWMRVDGLKKSPLAFDNMGERPIKGTADWKKYEIVLDVPEDSAQIAFGILMKGKGRVWVDDFKFEAVDNKVDLTGLKVESQDADITVPDNQPKKPENLDFEK